MKKLVFLFVILFSAVAQAQQVIPISTYNSQRSLIKLNKKKITHDNVQQNISEIRKMKRLLLGDSLKSNGLFDDKINQLQLSQTYLDEANDVKTESEEIDKPKDSITIQLVGLGGITDLENIKTAGGNAAIGFTIHWGDRSWCKDQCRTHPRNFVYALYNTRTGSSSDTASIHKTFLFPDISKRDVTIGYERHYMISRPCDTCSHNGLWYAIPFAELSTSRYSDTNNNGFRSVSALIGCKISFQGQIDLGGIKNFGVSFIPYYNVIDVDSKYASAYNSALQETNLPTTFRSVGLNIIGTISDFQIFANYKYVLHDKATNSSINSTELKAGNVTIGVLLSTSIFSFRIPR